MARSEAIMTDRLRSYGIAMKEIGIVERQQCGRRLNNWVENLHQLLRQREGTMAKSWLHQDSAEVRLCPCLDPQLLQPGSPPQPPCRLQGQPRSSLGQSDVSWCSEGAAISWRLVRIRLEHFPMVKRNWTPFWSPNSIAKFFTAGLQLIARLQKATTVHWIETAASPATVT